MSIRSKILAGCLALTLLSGWLGLFAQGAERRLGRVALDIYDNAFMAVSYLREAQIDFARLAADPQGAGHMGDRAQEVLDDLDVVRDRAMSARGRTQAAALRARAALLLPGLATHQAESATVQRDFDRLVETFADDGFRYRRRVGLLVKSQVRRTSLAIGASLLAALAITMLLSRLIAPPVRRAVRIAQSIAAGRLDNEIVSKGRGETGDLLRALSTMQSAIASGMTRIQTLMDQQAASHAGEIAARHAQMQAALANMNQGLCLFDADGRLQVANLRFAEIFGAPELGASSDDVLRAAGLGAVAEISRGGALPAFSCDLTDGRSIAVAQQAIAGGGWVATYEDVTERRATEARLSHMARHDLLTGLPNRLSFVEHVTRGLTDIARSGGAGRGLAVLCLDLDRFKIVNDTLGHGVGDGLLRAAAGRMRECVRKGDLVARLGGDEFAIVQDVASQDGVGQPAAATMLAQRIIAALSAPFEIEQHQIVIGVSVGVALTHDGAATPDALLTRADLALYRAKAGDRGGFCFFEAAMDTAMQARRMLEQDLRRAVAEQQFELFYQPLMQSGAGISGFEALLRWRHPERGLVSPAVFIPLAEEVGLMPVIGKLVLCRACTDAVSWPAAMKVAVNLSPLQFRDGLVEEVADALAESGLSARRLELEITESVLLQDDEKVLASLHAIRALGVRIAMDDFGTGYSSLGYLRRFPFDKIKIDQSFVRGMTEREDCLAIVRAVIGLGRSLGIAINAEGVENVAQRAALLREGCGELQGFLFSKPRPASAVQDMLRELGHERAVSAQAPRHEDEMEVS